MVQYHKMCYHFKTTDFNFLAPTDVWVCMLCLKCYKKGGDSSSITLCKVLNLDLKIGKCQQIALKF